MSARDNALRWTKLLRNTLLLRSILATVGGATLAAAVAIALGVVAFGVVALGGGSAQLFAAALVGGALGWFLARRAAPGPITVERTALWIEERDPRLRFALVTAAGAATPHAALERAVRAVDWEASSRRALWRSLRLPALAAATGIVSLAVAPRVAPSLTAGARATSTPRAPQTGAAPLGDLRVTITPPAYARRSVQRFITPALVRALPGSRVEVTGAQANDAQGTALRVELEGKPVDTHAVGGDWIAAWIATPQRALFRASRGNDIRLLAIEPVVDSAPVVTLRLPVRDTVLRTATGSLSLGADVTDDYGITSGAFEYIVSSGEGERFTFRSGTLGARRGAGGDTSMALRATLDLTELRLAPGDVVHLRAVARDANTVTGPGIGTSDSRTLRIARQGEYDSVAVDAAPPPEADKSLVSQRMLINLTEALVRRTRALGRAGVVGESQRIGRDQTRLRKQVSDIIFARLGDGAAGEHFHGDGHQHGDDDRDVDGPLTPEQLLKAAEKATEISGAPTDFADDETPVVAINRPLLEAYNAMWDASRELGAGEPKRALPPMYVALAAIQRARAAERLYLRGAPPPVVVDLAKVRLQGRERGSPGARTARPPVDAERRAALARFSAVLDGLSRAQAPAPRGGAQGAERGGPDIAPDGAPPALTTQERAMIFAAAVDSLLILRLTVAERNASAAAALEAAIDALRGGRDATDALIRSRRALDEDFTTHDAVGLWGGAR